MKNKLLTREWLIIFLVGASVISVVIATWIIHAKIH